MNDALVQEISVFKEQTNVFDEYMFSSFYQGPMPQEMIRRLMWLNLTEMHTRREDKEYAKNVFDDFFRLIWT